MSTEPPRCLKTETTKNILDIYEKYKGILVTEMQVFSDILAMYDVCMVDGMAFYKTSDRDLLAAYKNLYTRIIKGQVSDNWKYNEFRESYEELVQRRYMKCLWKSQPEFVYYFSDWTKEFIGQNTYMKRGNRVLRIKDIKLFNDDQQVHKFFYFYYRQSVQEDIDVFGILDWLKSKI